MVATELSRDVQVKQYSYRSAIAGEVFLKVPRDLMKDLEEALAKKAGARIDNHTVYEVIYDGGASGNKTTYIWFSDQKAFLGNKLIEGRF